MAGIIAAKRTEEEESGKQLVALPLRLGIPLFSIRFNKVTETSFIPYLEALSNMVVVEIRFSKGRESAELTLSNDLCKSPVMSLFLVALPQA